MTTNKRTAQTLCHGGCGGITKGGRYLPGHDAKHKKALIEAALGGSKRAVTKLEKLGWSKFLDASLVSCAKPASVPAPKFTAVQSAGTSCKTARSGEPMGPPDKTTGNASVETVTRTGN